MTFPYQSIPAGGIAVSHHATWALVLSIIPLMHVWDNHRLRSPWPAVTAVVVALLAFLLVWPTHHVLGAALAVAATVAAVVVLGVRLVQSIRAENPLWPPLPLLIALALALVALDDVLQHAFGWPTPLDWTWKHHLRPRLPSH